MYVIGLHMFRENSCETCWGFLLPISICLVRFRDDVGAHNISLIFRRVDKDFVEINWERLEVSKLRFCVMLLGCVYDVGASDGSKWCIVLIL